MKKSILPFILLSLFASALNYFAYPLLARLLPSSEYVNITVALSIFTQISTFLSSLSAVTIGLTKIPGHSSMLHRLQISLLQVFSVFGIIFLILSPLIMSSVHTPVVYALPIVLMILMSIPITIISGYLNGRQLMTKLGLVAVITASLQFITGIVTATLSNNGFLTMLCMGSVQIISIHILLRFLKDSTLPRISKELFVIEKYSSRATRLLLFVIAASFAIMAINLLQIFDLLVIKNIDGSTAKAYTDVYIISRIVFFGGMILIWPFLGALKLDDNRSNKRAYMKLLGIFGLLGVVVISTLTFAGGYIVQLLFGQNYYGTQLNETLLLSTLYKLFFLIITAVCLYFIVFRSIKSIYFGILVSVLITVSYLLADASDVQSILSHLTAAAGVSSAIGSYMVLRFTLSERQ